MTARNTTILVLSLLFSQIVLSQKITSLIKNSAYLKTASFDTSLIKKNQLLINLKHSSSKIEFTEEIDSLKDKVIYAIDLIYTETDKSKFNQEKLNTKRLTELKKVAPYLINNNLIYWRFIEQKQLTDNQNKNLFHGYLVTYRPEIRPRNGMTEADILKKLVRENSTPCNGKDSSTSSSSLRRRKYVKTYEPKFKGGTSKFKDYFYSKVRYTPSMAEGNVSGNLFITFYLDELGELSKIKTNKALTDECRNAVKKALQEMPKWIPGINKHKKPTGGIFRLSLFFSRESKRVLIKYLNYQGPYSGETVTELLTDYFIPEHILCDSIVFSVLERNKHWKKISIVADLTGSMLPYTNQLILWFKLNTINESIKYLTFFNDGDDTPHLEKKTGKVGGIYQSEAKTFEDLLNLAVNTMSHGGGGDLPENNIEATLAAIEKYPEAEEIVMIADNYATPRDLTLLKKVKRPIRLILCGTFYGFNVDYLNLIRKNGGSIHTIENDLLGLTKLKEGEIITFGNKKHKIINEKFVEIFEI